MALPLAAKLGIGAVTLGALGYGMYRWSEARAATRRPSPLPPPPEPDHDLPPVDGRRNFIGSGWTGWPHKDVFPDVDAIVQAFRRIGYDVGDNLLSEKSMDAVGDFQQDYNLWSARYGMHVDVDEKPLEWPAEPYYDQLDEDELVGYQTVDGLHDALVADEHFPGGWPGLVLSYS